MKVNNISESQPQFKGKLVLYNVRQNGKNILCKTIDTQGITIEQAPEYLKGLAYAAKTLVRTNSNEVFELNIPYETVEAAYKRVVDTDKSENLIPSSEYSTPGFFG